MMATLYNHYAAEYKALAYQAYNLAQMQLDRIQQQGAKGKKSAVVVDIDETVLDNTPYEAESLLRDKPYPACWDAWMRQASASAIPGAVSFLKRAKAQGFEVFYISNRLNRYLMPTLKNLQKEGFPNADALHVFLKGVKSHRNPHPERKESRRKYIESGGYEIALLMGDNLRDFYRDRRRPKGRERLVQAHRAEFGRRFILLPNPMYGNWARTLHTDDPSAVHALLEAMSADLDASCSKPGDTK